MSRDSPYVRSERFFVLAFDFTIRRGLVGLLVASVFGDKLLQVFNVLSSAVEARPAKPRGCVVG